MKVHHVIAVALITFVVVVLYSFNSRRAASEEMATFVLSQPIQMNTDRAGWLKVADTGPGAFTWGNLKPAYLTIQGSEGKPLVTISLRDGSVDFADGYTPDEGARAFWLTMGHAVRCEPPMKAPVVPKLRSRVKSK